MSKRTARKPHIQTPPERTPPRSPPEPPQRHTPKPIAPEPHQSGGQTHRQPHFLPFSTMQDFLQYEDLSCRKTFIKFFCGECDKAPAFLLYICTEGTPHGTPGATPGNSQGRTGQDHRTGQPERRQGGTNSRPAHQRAEPKQQRPPTPPRWANFPDMDSEPENKDRVCRDPCRESISTPAC